MPECLFFFRGLPPVRRGLRLDNMGVASFGSGLEGVSEYDDGCSYFENILENILNTQT